MHEVVDLFRFFRFVLVQVWHHTFFDALRVNPEEQPCIVSEASIQTTSSVENFSLSSSFKRALQAPMNPKKNRERMVEMLFEK